MRKVKSSSVAIQAFPVDDKSPRMNNAVGFGKAKQFDIGLSNYSMPPYPFPDYPNMYPEKEKTTRFDLGLSSASAASSTVGSPLSNHGQYLPVIEWASNDVGMGSRDHFSPGYNFAGDSKSVDPAMIYHSNIDMIYPDSIDIMYPGNRGPFLEDSWSFGHLLAHPSHGNEETLVHKHSTCPASPALSVSSYQHVSHYGPLQNHNDMSFGSTPTQTGRISSTSPFTPNYPFTPAFSSDNTETKKERCPHPDCGKTFKDLKAHMLTHQTERPEKCPIMSCEYHIKGFARKYDKNRHTLTHYKGTMVCGFCPGSGSPAEKSFNRADVFKRHLTTVHRVDRKPPNSQHQTMSLVATICNTSPRSSPPSTNGDCSTCSRTFSNPQMFYEHLDNCLLHVLEDMDSADVMNRRPSTEVNACFSLPRSISINIMRSTRENLDIIPVKDRRLMSSAESTSSRMGKLPNVTELHTATEAMSSLLRIPSDRVGCFLDTSRIFMKKSSYFVERMLTDPTTGFKITKASRGFRQRLSLLVQSQIWGLVPWTSHRGWNISF